MTTTGADASAVTAEQITEIAQEVWESFLSLTLLPHPLGPDAPGVTGRHMTGCVAVSGEWTGSVFLSCDLELAAAAAEAMFAAEAAGQPVLDELVYVVPRHAVDAAIALGEVFDAADAYCREGRLRI